MRPRLYWFRFEGFPVTFPALPTKHFRWQRICGVQIGSWFFGAVKGGPGKPWDSTGDAADRVDIFVPWQADGKDCIHPHGHERSCATPFCPRKAVAAKGAER